VGLRRLFLLSLAWSGTCVGASAAEPPPSWRLVPEETMLLARVPSGSEFIDALRRQTKFGTTILSRERIEKLIALQSDDGEEGAKDFMSQVLGQIDLRGEDYVQLLEGELGAALVVLPDAKHGPQLVGLGWLEPRGGLAEKLVTAIQKTIDEQRDDAHPVRRVDLDLAGHTVTHLSIPLLTSDVQEPHPDFQPNAELTAENIRQQQAKRAEMLKNVKKIEIGRANVFFTRANNRLLLCGTLPRFSVSVWADDGEPEDEPGSDEDSDAEQATFEFTASWNARNDDLDELSGVEAATGVFARFLEAHGSQGGDTAPPILAAPGLEAALPTGIPLMEIVGDLGRVLKLAETPGDPTVSAVFQALGIDTLGAVAIRTVLDGTALRTGTFICAPAPRHGLLTFLDQPALPAGPPDWAPSSARAYRHVSFDLGKAYTEIRDLAVALGGDEAKQDFDSADGEIEALLQTNVAGLLSSLGQRHTFISFSQKRAEASTAADCECGGICDPLATALSDVREGIVWQVKDEQVWMRLMRIIADVPEADDLVMASEEQGFTGYRLKRSPLDAGFFVGRGYLVLGIGEEVTESLLAVLRTLPTGVAALRSSSLVERAKGLLAPEAGLEYQISDAGREMKDLKELLTSLLSGPLPGAQVGAVSGDSRAAHSDAALTEKLKALFPSDEDLEGSVGVSVCQTVVNGYGLVRQSVIELPAP